MALRSHEIPKEEIHEHFQWQPAAAKGRGNEMYSAHALELGAERKQKMQVEGPSHRKWCASEFSALNFLNQ